jgi:hypothetical protein
MRLLRAVGSEEAEPARMSERTPISVASMADASSEPPIKPKCGGVKNLRSERSLSTIPAFITETASAFGGRSLRFFYDQIENASAATLS